MRCSSWAATDTPASIPWSAACGMPGAGASRAAPSIFKRSILPPPWSAGASISGAAHDFRDWLQTNSHECLFYTPAALIIRAPGAPRGGVAMLKERAYGSWVAWQEGHSHGGDQGYCARRGRPAGGGWARRGLLRWPPR